MTGRDLIVYILNNHLEDSEVNRDGRLLDFLTVEEAAAKYNVTATTIEIWLKLGTLRHVKLSDNVYMILNER